MRLVSLPATRVVCLSLFTLVLIAILLLPQLVTGRAGGNFPTLAAATNSGLTFTELNPQRSYQQAVALANFDVRLAEDAASTEYMAGARSRKPARVLADLAGMRAAGVARLEVDFQAIDVLTSPELGTPEVVSARPGAGFLTRAATDRVGALRTFLSTYADAYGLSPQGVGSLELVANYQNPAANMAWVEFEQRINGLPVFRGLIRGGFTATGQLARTTGALIGGLDSSSLPVLPTLNAAQAVSRAAANVGWDVNEGTLVQKTASGSHVTFARGAMADDAKAWLLYFPLAPGVARLAWATEIWGDPDVFLVLLDAEDGTILFRKNLTDYQSQAATYNVFLNDSPAPMSPSTVLPGSGTQAPFDGRTLLTLIGNEAPNTFNNLGWLTNDANGTNGWTDGNNVEVGIDRDAVDGVDAPASGVNRVFNFPCTPETAEPLTAACQNAEVADTFYWINVYHDRLYLVGFTEAARNFQNDNFGRGGVAADRIRAESQDSSGTNNANFATPADGTRGRMQMYIFDKPAPNRTSGLDHEVLLHELTHGTSNRLHNNATGLTSPMSRGMGEGWSDFYARVLLSSADEDPNGIYTTGGWVTYELAAGFHDNYYYGIRRFPYAVKSTVGANGKPHNPLTFADLDQAQFDLSDGAFPRNPILGSWLLPLEVHNIGELWCMALLEVRARFIARLGFATGNQRILQFVTDGMKLDPVNPTLLQGRDSIIAAANAGGGSAADIADIRAGFATRGMGVTAQIVNTPRGTVVESFDVTVPANTGRLTGYVRRTGTNAAFANAVVTASPGGRSSTTNADGSYEMYLPVGTYTVTASAGDFVEASSSGVVIVDQATTTRDFSLQRSPHLLAQLAEPSKSNVKLADLDGDGKSELIFTTLDPFLAGGSRVRVLSSSGSELPGWPVTLSGRPLSNTPAVGDIDGDGRLDIVVQTFANISLPVTDPQKVWAFSADGVLKSGFPVALGSAGDGWTSGLFTTANLPSPTLADLDADGVPEIIAIWLGSALGTDAGAVVALKGNGAIIFRTILPRSVAPGRFFDEYPHYSVPMVGNLTGDASPEIVVGVHAEAAPPAKTFFALTATGAFLPAWPVRLAGTANPPGIIETGALGDLNRDGHDEFIVTSPREGSTPPKLYVFDGSGQVMSGFPKDLPGSGTTVSYPALADVDHDGFLDIVTFEDASVSIISQDTNYYLLAHNRLGGLVAQTSWSGINNNTFGQTFNQLRLALAEDAAGQVCAVFPIPQFVSNQANLQLQARCLNGQVVPGFPLTLPSLCDTPFCQNAKSVSLGRDSGSTEVYAVLVDESGNVRRWEIFNSTRPIPWSQFQHDAASTGLARNPQTLTVTRAGTGIGMVSSSLSGISCGATCAADFNSGTVVALTAFADAGSSFTGWTGDCSGSGACLVTMSQARNVTATFTTLPVSNVQFSAASHNVGEGDSSATISVTRTGDTSGLVTVAFATADGSAQQQSDYAITAGTLTLSPGEASKTFVVQIVDDVYVEGSETLNLTLSNPTGGAVLGSPGTATLTVIDNDPLSPTTNPLDNSDARFFVRQHYNDFLSRAPDQGGFDFWAGQITQCGSDQTCIRNKRIDVSNAFFYELEYQQTAAYVFRLYRAAFGNNQPFPNPDSSNLNEAKKIPSYAAFSQDRSRLIGSANLAPDQLALANLFVTRAEFLSKYSAGLTLDQFVDAVITAVNNDDGVDLTAQRSALISLGSRGAVLYRIADDNLQANPIHNRPFIDAEYNRSFVASQYFGYLRRDADIGGFLFWLGQVSGAPLRDTLKQHAMVCSFITSGEYQLRFSSVVTRTNAECQ